MPHTDFDFVDDASGGHFVLVGGPMSQLRQLLAKGEVEVAVKAYEETGGAAREELLQEAQTASLDTRRHIGQLFRRARDFAAAARVFQGARLDEEAATTFEQAGDFVEAAGCWQRANEPLKAAAAFERAGRTEEAVALYRKANAGERVAECLARGHRYLEAAQEFRAQGKTHAEVESLRAGLSADPSDLKLAGRLASLMLEHGRKEQAAQLLVDTAQRNPTAKDDPQFLALLAGGLEILGNAAAAAKVRARLAQFPPGAVAAAAAMPSAAPTAPASPVEAGGEAYAALKALPMFADLALADMKALYRVCSLLSFQAGQNVIEPGQPGRGLFVIVDGQVEVFAGAGPTARQLNSLGVGAYVGEISLVQDAPTSARVTAKTPVRALFISREAFNQYVYAAPNAALRIYQLFTRNLAERVRVLSAPK